MRIKIILIFSKCKQKLSHQFLSPILPSFVNNNALTSFPFYYYSEFRKFQLENVLRIILRSPGSGILSFFISFPLLLLTNHISQSAQTFCVTWFSTPIKKTFSKKWNLFILHFYNQEPESEADMKGKCYDYFSSL